MNLLNIFSRTCSNRQLLTPPGPQSEMDIPKLLNPPLVISSGKHGPKKPQQNPKPPPDVLAQSSHCPPVQTEANLEDWRKQRVMKACKMCRKQNHIRSHFCKRCGKNFKDGNLRSSLKTNKTLRKARFQKQSGGSSRSIKPKRVERKSIRRPSQV